LLDGRPLRLRYPTAVRPWQHVLEPIAGYLSLARLLVEDPASCPPAVNFGPDAEACRSVGDIAEMTFALAGAGSWEPDHDSQPPEHQTLTLDSSLAREALGWRPHLTIDQALAWTVDWWAAKQRAENMREVSLAQIREYVARAPS
jgi:CDP-glucose 4,6-dehydratase